MPILSILSKGSVNRDTKGLMQPLPIPEDLWHTVTVDFIGELPKTLSGFNAVLVAVDKFSKMVTLIPTMTTLTAVECSHLLHANVFSKHGWPAIIVSDRDKLFTSQFWTAYTSLQGIDLGLSTAYHPQTDGQTEVANRVIEDMLRHYINPTLDDWDLHLPCAEFAINNSHTPAISTTPFFLNYGRHPRTPLHLALAAGTTRRMRGPDSGPRQTLLRKLLLKIFVLE